MKIKSTKSLRISKINKFKRGESHPNQIQERLKLENDQLRKELKITKNRLMSISLLL